MLLASESAAGMGLKMWAYVGFLVFVAFCLALDLGVFHREAHEVSIKEAASWSVVWVTLSLLFSVFVYAAYERHWLGLGMDTPRYNGAAGPGDSPIVRGEVGGLEAAEQYLAGYVVEFSLAMDNIFVIAIILSFFAVPGKYQHRVLFWGIVGAVLMRGGMIFLGAELVVRHTWVLIVFGCFLLLTAGKMALIRGTTDPSMNIVVRLAKRVLPLCEFHVGQSFFTRRTVAPTYSADPTTGRLVMDPAPAGSLGSLAMTPLFLALVMVEVTDLIFAVDSIPAIFAVTPDPFIVFTSNIFAILGLRSLYFCLAAMIARFRFLKPALILILAFVGVKLLLLSLPPYVDEIGGWFGAAIGPFASIKIDTRLSLGVVVALLGGAVALSAVLPPRRHGLENA